MYVENWAVLFVEMYSYSNEWTNKIYRPRYGKGQLQEEIIYLCIYRKKNN